MKKKLLKTAGIAAILAFAATAAAATDLATAKQYCKLAGKDPMQAIDNCTKVIESSGTQDQVQAYNFRGRAYLVHGWLDMSLADFNAALKLDPNSALLHNNRALVLRQLGRYDEALAGHDRAISLDKGNEHYQRTREKTLERKGRGS